MGVDKDNLIKHVGERHLNSLFSAINEAIDDIDKHVDKSITDNNWFYTDLMLLSVETGSELRKKRNQNKKNK